VADSDIHLKCDDYDEKAKWITAINFFRKQFSSEGVFSEYKYKEKLDDETSLRIYAENEILNWSTIKVPFKAKAQIRLHEVPIRQTSFRNLRQ
jgi:hypothetical protein